jgi:hypothetical protein
MFRYLCDVIVKLKPDSPISQWQYMYFNDYPINLLDSLSENTGIAWRDVDSVTIWYFDYGEDFGGVGENTLRENRAKINPFNHLSANFLHPIFHHWNNVSTHRFSEKPDRVWGLAENVLTQWLTKSVYADFLEEFLFSTLGAKTNYTYRIDCMLASIEEESLPNGCDCVYDMLLNIT